MTSAPAATGPIGPEGMIRPAGKPQQSQVAEARRRLTTGVAKPEFEYELLSMFVKNELGAILTIPLLAIIIALASMFWAQPGHALLWRCGLAQSVRFAEVFAESKRGSGCHWLQRLKIPV